MSGFQLHFRKHNLERKSMNRVTKNINKILLVSCLGLSSTYVLHANVPLKNDSMTFLNTVLATMPIVTIRLNKTSQAIKETMNAIKNFPAQTGAARSTDDSANEAALIALQLNQILGPVREFFNEVVEHSSMIKPILEESNSLHPKLEHPLLLNKFFSTENKHGIEDFCRNEIKDIHTLKKLCTELGYFINDINKSLSPETKAAYHAKLEEMRKEIKAHSPHA